MKTFQKCGQRCRAAFPGLAALFLIGAAGCSARRGEPFRGPFVAGDARIEHGRQVFMAQCYKCHPGGEAGLGPSLNDKPLPRFLIKLQVRAGLGVMPAFGPHEISPGDLDDLVAYLKALRAH